MKKFEAPKISVEKFEISDVISSSPCAEDCVGFECSNDTGCIGD